VLDTIAAGQTPTDLRTDLALVHQSALGRPILPATDVPAGIRLPTLGTAYVNPDFRAAEATEAPLLVLGSPRSSRHGCTRASSDLQDQIERSVRAVTGQTLTWPRLVETAGDALPVVLLDGFDELLQATGVSQSDYLEKVNPSIRMLEQASTYPELARQPLLLLMLALFDATGSELQRADGSFRELDLYEGLLTQFAECEVRKDGAELDADLAVLLGLSETKSSGMRAALTEGQMLVGRFFFIHQAVAVRDNERLRTYEFLHATFGEHLVAGPAARELSDMVKIARLNRTRIRQTPVEDDFLHALLSFAPLTLRGTTLTFLKQVLLDWPLLSVDFHDEFRRTLKTLKVKAGGT
jgi:hypothetical protein